MMIRASIECARLGRMRCGAVAHIDIDPESLRLALGPPMDRTRQDDATLVTSRCGRHRARRALERGLQDRGVQLVRSSDRARLALARRQRAWDSRLHSGAPPPRWPARCNLEFARDHGAWASASRRLERAARHRKERSKGRSGDTPRERRVDPVLAKPADPDRRCTPNQCTGGRHDRTHRPPEPAGPPARPR